MAELQAGDAGHAANLSQSGELRQIVQDAFSGSLDCLRTELQVMPLDSWNESVFRYFFCKAVATSGRDVEQFVECGKIDLVLKHGEQRAFIEFKFYGHPRRFDPYDGRERGFKGGPGAKNLSEFRACIDQLSERPRSAGLTKFVVIVYADPTDGSRPGRRFARQYDAYEHSRADVSLRVVESKEVVTADRHAIRAQLIEVGAVQET